MFSDESGDVEEDQVEWHGDDVVASLDEVMDATLRGIALQLGGIETDNDREDDEDGDDGEEGDPDEEIEREGPLVFRS